MGSPAPTQFRNEMGNWFYDFMTAVNVLNPGREVDLIALHYYAWQFDVPTAVAARTRPLLIVDLCYGVGDDRSLLEWRVDNTEEDYERWDCFCGEVRKSAQLARWLC